MFGYIYKKDVAIIAVVLCLCLGVGSFFDYQISSALFNIGSMYGRFIEAAGELPFELTASIAGVMLVRAVRPDSRGSKWLAVLGILVNIGLAGYEIVSSLRVGGKLIAAQLVLTFVLAIVANLIVYRLTRTTEPDELTRWALMVLVVWVAQAIILNVIVKPLWSRPRMRVIEVTPGLNFQPWWVIGNPDKWAYIAAGVYSDHECSNVEEAMAKLERGQFIMIREGTAARNLEALAPLLCEKYIERCMFCTDDKHPNDLLEKGHIDYIVKKAISLGADPIMAVKAAGYTAARYFLLNNRGAIAPGYLADFVVIDNWENFDIEMVYKKGKLMYDGVLRDFDTPEIDPYLVKRAHDTFHVASLSAADFTDKRPHAVIGMVPGEIVSEDAGYADHIDLEQDILKIAVIERHKNTHHIGLGYIKGYGLKHGAVATSISHDSHNIIVVGTSEEDMAAAANRIVENRGGITVMDGGQILGEVALPIAGIMSDDSLVMVNSALEAAKDEAFRLGVSRGIDPFMTLSFMALPVIPSLRLTTRGVFDVLTQRYV